MGAAPAAVPAATMSRSDPRREGDKRHAAPRQRRAILYGFIPYTLRVKP